MKLKKLFFLIMIIVLFSIIFEIKVFAKTTPILKGEEIIGYENGYFRIKTIKSQTYTGSEIIPEIEVFDYNTGTKLTKGIDYEAYFYNNIYPNGYYSPKAVIKGIGRYSNAENLITYFAIFSKNISNNNAELKVLTPHLEYDGQEKKPEVELICDGVKLVENVDYELIFVDENVNAGCVYILASGIGNYSGSQGGRFYIEPKPILEEDINVDTSDRIYTGNDILPEVTVKSGKKTLVKGVDYEVAYPYTDYINFTGRAWIEIWGLGNYKGNFTKYFNILSKDITSISTINIDSSDKKFTNSFIEPLVELKDGNYTLIKNKDYTVSYSNNVNVGKATIKVTGLNVYKGEITKTFNILENNINFISSINIDTSDKLYTGNAIKPNVELKDGNYTLKNMEDYLVYYYNNINLGTATIRIAGKGIYSGEIVKTFNIIKKDISKISTINIDTTNKVYTGSSIETNIDLKDGSYTLVINKDYRVTYSNNDNPGIATLKITGLGTYNGEIVKTFNILQNDINKISTINIDTSNKQYTGNNITTSIVLKSGTYTLVNGKDYTVGYSNNKNYGTATITITGKGAYTGRIVKTFKIVPRKISITSLKNTILRCVAIKWNKDTSVSGYEIYRATSKNGTYSLVKTITRNSTDSNTFVAQKKGTYYYKVRSYVTVNGAKIYGDFSDIQMVNVTK